MDDLYWQGAGGRSLTYHNVFGWEEGWRRTLFWYWQMEYLRVK
jgi:hypothetical protein